MPYPTDLILGIDTSCDETSVAVLKNGTELLSNIISSQIKIHQPHGGVVPELASRSHLENLPRVVDEALHKAGITLSDLTAIAVTNRPGLIGCLLVGLSYAKSLAYSLNIPFTLVNHLKAHLFSGFIGHDERYPFLGLVVSGGHTALYYVKSFDDILLLGQTVDDAAGEAYDKVAKLLSLGYPGGPIIDKRACQGNSDSISFTRARVKKGEYFWSFSGLKTAVAKIVKENQKSDALQISDLCAAFQKEVVGSLLDKIERAFKEYPVKALVISGGVAANSLLRTESQKISARFQVPCYIPSLLLCTDNGGMIAYVGAKQIARGDFAELNANAQASVANLSSDF